MLTTDEILEYIEAEDIERDVNLLILFNDIDFYLLPLRTPEFIYEEEKFFFRANGYKVFANDFFEINFTDISDKIVKWISSPQYLYACQIGFKNQGILEIAYSRDDEGIIRLWHNVVSDFIECANIQSIEHLNEAINKAKNRYQIYQRSIKSTYKYNVDEICELDIFWKIPITNHTDSLNNKKLHRVLKHKFDDIIGYFFNNYRYTIGIDSELYLGRHPITNRYVELQFIINFKNLTVLQTPIASECSIVSEDDKIPDILYNIAVSIKATDFRMAVGYAYKKGIELILPTILIVKNLKGSVELGIGALQNYNTSQHVLGMDKLTANYINRLVEDGYIDGVFTCDEKFYHGKFYYISNGEISYVLVGSSNITKSAFTDNTEFDVLFRMDLSENQMRERDSHFAKWYGNLKARTTFLNVLDVEKFTETTHTGKSKKQSSDNAIRRSLTNKEENDRLDLILKYSPEIHPSPFVGAGKSSFKAFKKYHVFVFAEKNVIILESFSYGDACYAFSAGEFSIIKNIFSYTSKMQIKASDYYITSIEHDGNYEKNFVALMNNV